MAQTYEGPPDSGPSRETLAGRSHDFLTLNDLRAQLLTTRYAVPNTLAVAMAPHAFGEARK